jgi:hypothetical protein
VSEKKEMMKKELSATRNEDAGYWEVNTADGEFVTNVTDPNVTAGDAVAIARDRIQNQPQRTGIDSGVPDAPFKKNWHDLTFRRMAYEAAKRDMDSISWTPGEVQADRYDLSKQMNSIEVIPEGGGTYEIMGVDKQGNGIGIATGVGRDKVADHIGKDLADKAMTQLEGLEGIDAASLSREFDKLNRKARTKRGLTKAEKSRLENVESALNDEMIFASFEGLDLKIGGEGEKYFYDVMIRKSADKLGKKYGVKAEVQKITPDVDPTTATDAELSAVIRSGGPEALEAGYDVWSLPLTPELKKALLKGGVTFGIAGMAMDQDNETLGLLKKPRK